MPGKFRFITAGLLVAGLAGFLAARGQQVPGGTTARDTIITSAQYQAFQYLESLGNLEPSASWPFVRPALFLQNLKTNILQPMSVYPGNGTNFCGYGALTYLLLQDDPLGYAETLVRLYKEGRSSFGSTHIRPSAAVMRAAGQLRFKGVLDIRPAEQMWYLSLADHFKGYLNFLNRKYDMDDEDTFWASVNYAKFNRMLRKLLPYGVQGNGGDLFRPKVGDLYSYISARMETGTVVLFINNRMLHKKNHKTFKLGYPTHFIVAEAIRRDNDLVTFVYWDYGGKTLLQLSPSLLKRIVYGITYFSKTGSHAD